MTQYAIKNKRENYFFQIDNAIFDLGLNSYEIAVYARLCFRGSLNQPLSWESLDTICKACCISRPTLLKSLKRLESLQVIAIERRKDQSGRDTSNLYTLLDQKVWLKNKDKIDDEGKGDLPWRVKEIYPEGKGDLPWEGKGDLPDLDPLFEKDPKEQDPKRRERERVHAHAPAHYDVQAEEKSETESPSPSAPVPALSKPSDDSLNLKGIDNPEASISLAKEWLEWAKSQSPWNTAFTLHNFAEAILTIQRQGKFNHEPVRRLFEYIKRDDFWAKNAISPSGLTKRKNGSDMRKWETVMHQMQANKDYRTKIVQSNIAQLGGKSLF